MKAMKAQVTLTPTESKRLIAKALVRHEKIKEAFKKGIIAIALGSTNAYFVEELLKRRIDKKRYVAGMTDDKGTCVVPAKMRMESIILENGRIIDEKIEDAARRMGRDDVFVKGANALDFEGIAGVMLASESGGTIGHVLGILKARGVNILIPIGLEKLVPGSINEGSKRAGIYHAELSTGIPVGIMPLTGEVITELDAFKLLGGSEAYVLGSGGIGSGEGSVTFLIEGAEQDVKNIFELVKNIKGEKKIVALRGECKDCTYKHCPYSKGMKR